MTRSGANAPFSSSPRTETPVGTVIVADVLYTPGRIRTTHPAVAADTAVATSFAAVSHVS